MTRFVWNFLIVTTLFVFANSQLCLAQVEIVDGDGKQVDKNDIPGEVVQQRPATGELPQDNPQIFGGGNGSSICLLYTSPSPRDATLSRMPSSA